MDRGYLFFFPHYFHSFILICFHMMTLFSFSSWNNRINTGVSVLSPPIHTSCLSNSVVISLALHWSGWMSSVWCEHLSPAWWTCPAVYSRLFLYHCLFSYDSSTFFSLNNLLTFLNPSYPSQPPPSPLLQPNPHPFLSLCKDSHGGSSKSSTICWDRIKTLPLALRLSMASH